MNRGVTHLNNNQLKIAFESVKNSPHLDQLLINKLAPNAHNGDLIQVELSEEQAEIILDNLPMPADSEEQELTNLRKTIQQFLTSVRFGQEKT